ncbi:MAG: hypothetical protein GKS07_08465 [Nitrosopumilus sp.]|nr:MAG: hypothetical protein GKS07_08465 [Nitrosopumilus sp.]
MLTGHIVMPYQSGDIFYRAFKKALIMAKQDHAKITLVKAIHHIEDMGPDMYVVTSATSNGRDVDEFAKILPYLQNEAALVKVDFHFEILDMPMSPAESVTEFALKSQASAIILCKTPQRGLWKKYFTSDITQDIMNLNPSCDVVLVE